MARPIEASRSQLPLRTVSLPPPAPRAAATRSSGSGDDLFDGVAKAGEKLLGGVGGIFGHLFDRPFTMGRDGFVALNEDGSIAGGRAPSAEVRDMRGPKAGFDPLLKILADGDAHDVSILADGDAHDVS